MNIRENNNEVIQDFGQQWTRFPANTGYYASLDVLERLMSPLINPDGIKGKKIADIGAGTGRYTIMLSKKAPQTIAAFEPSSAFKILQENTSNIDNIHCYQLPAEKIPPMDFDLAICVGVIQFIPDPKPALRAIGKSLGTGGQAFFWVYGRENNELYLRALKPLRFISTRVPHRVLDKIATLLLLPAKIYSSLCSYFALPMKDYFQKYFSKMDFYSQKMIIFDQLNPGFVYFYRKNEIIELLESSGFYDIHIHHHLGYSWSLLARYEEDCP